MIYEINGAHLVRINQKLRSLHDKEIGEEFRTNDGKIFKHTCIEKCRCKTAKLWREMLDLPTIQKQEHLEFKHQVQAESLP
mgnify:FL=1|jgi:hypothetical protein